MRQLILNIFFLIFIVSCASKDYSIDEIRLYDINGKLVLTALPKQSNFSLSTELKSGIYILNSTNQKGAISSHKITVTKIR